MHVTLRVLDDVPRLRRAAFVRAFRESLRAMSRPGFRVVHYSVQNDHAHFLVEALGGERLANGMKSLGARFARCVNAFRAVRETGVRQDGATCARCPAVPPDPAHPLEAPPANG